MKRKDAMSTLGYAICSVMILGFVMILSAPMLLDNIKADNGEVPVNKTFEDRNDRYMNVGEEIHRVESSLSSRIDQLESAFSSNNSRAVSKKYVCTIDQSPQGQLEPVDGEGRKFVFICEYKD